MLKPQPPDEWSFLRPDVLTDDGVLDTLIAASEISPEEAALHIDRSFRHGPATDPGRAEVAIDPDLGAPLPTVSYFDDEEPEVAGSPWSNARSLAADDDRDDTQDDEPDLEEILESQHYAFAPEVADGPFTDPQRAGPV